MVPIAVASKAALGGSMSKISRVAGPTAALARTDQELI